MSTTIENRIINLQFNNADFEKNTAQTMNTIDKLKRALKFDGISKGFSNITNAAAKVSLNSMTTATTQVKNSFTSLERMAIGALENIGRKAENMAESFIKSVSVDQISAGFSKYAENTKAVQVMMNATGESMETIQEILDKLAWYTDETSYGFTDMTNNISKFTNAGVKLEEATAAMIGIGNAAGLAGASIQDASHAMAGFSKAMGAGYMSLQNWSWIQTAHMDTIEFKQSLIEIAEQLGTIKKGSIDVEDFSETLKNKWLTKEVIVEALGRYSKATDQLYEVYTNGDFDTTSEIIEAMGDKLDKYSLKAFQASQEAKTFEDAIESIKDAVSTGWMKTFDTIFGNYTEARVLWTDFANWLYDMFAESGNLRNELLKVWRGESEEELLFGPDGLTGRQYFLEALYSIFDTLTEYVNRFKSAWNSVFGEFDIYTLASITEQFHRFAQLFEHTLNDTEETINDPERKRSGVISKFHTIVREFALFVKEVRDLAVDFVTIVKYAFIDSFGDIDRDWTYFKGFSGWFINIIDYAKSFIKTIRNVLLESDRLYRIATGIASAAKMIWAMIEYIGRIFFGSSNGLLTVIVEFLATIADLITLTNDSKAFEVFKDAADATASILTIIFDVLTKIAKIVFAIKDVVFQFIAALSNKIKSTGSLQSLFDGFVSLMKNISELTGLDKITNFFTDLANTGSDFDFSFLDFLINGINLAIEALSMFVNSLASFVASINPYATQIKDTVSGIFNSVFKSDDLANGSLSGNENPTLWDSILNKIFTVKNAIFHTNDVNGDTPTIFDFILDKISNVREAITGFINGIITDTINPQTIAQIAGAIALIITGINVNEDIIKVGDFIDSLKEVPSSISGVFENLGGVFKSVQDFLGGLGDAIKTTTKLQLVNAIIKAIGTLAVSIALLASIPEAELYKATKYMVLLGMFLALLIKMISKGGVIYSAGDSIKNSTIVTKAINVSNNRITLNAGSVGIAAFIFALAAFVSSIVHAIEEIGSIDVNKLVTGSIVIGAILVGITVIIGVISSFGKRMRSTTTITNVSNILMANGTKKDNETKNTYTNYGSGYFWSIAGVIFAISAGVSLIVSAISTLADSLSNNVGATIGAFAMVVVLMAGIVGMIWLLIHIVKKDFPGEVPANLGKMMLSMATACAIVAVSVSFLIVPIIALAIAIKALDSNDTANVFGAFVVVILLMGALVGVMWAMKKFAVGIDPKSVLLMATSLAIVAGAVMVLALAMIPLAIMFALGNLSNKFNPALAAGLAIVAFVGVIALVMAAMGKAAMRGLKGEEAIKMAEAVVIMSLSMLVIAGALAVMAKTQVNAGHIVGLLVSFALAVAAVIGGFFLIFKFAAGNDIIKMKKIVESMTMMSTAVIILSASMMVIAGALAILGTIDFDKMGNNLLYFAGLFAAIIIVAGLLVVAASFLPGTVVYVILVIASLIVAISLVFFGMATAFATFGKALQIADKYLDSVTEKLKPFTAALKEMLSTISENWGILLIVSLTTVLLVAIIGSALTALVYIIVTNASTIGTALKSFFSAIGSAISSFGSWLNDLPDKTKRIIAGIAVAVASGLATATPQVYAFIEKAFLTFTERLGDSIGWIVEGLLKFVLSAIIGLADAIRHNSSYVAYAILDLLLAIGQVIIDVVNMVVFPIINTVVSLIGAAFKVASFKLLNSKSSDFLIDLLGTFLMVSTKALDTLLPGLGTKLFTEMAGEDISRLITEGDMNGLRNAMREKFKGIVGDEKEIDFSTEFSKIYEQISDANLEAMDNMHTGVQEAMDIYAEKYGIGDFFAKSIWTDDTKKKADEQIKQSTSDMQETINDQADSLIATVRSKMQSAKDGIVTTVSGWVGDFDLSKLTDKIKLGNVIDTSSFINMLTNASGNVDLDAFTKINDTMSNMQTQINPETMQNWEDAQAQLGLTGDAAGDVSESFLTLDESLINTANSTGNAVDTIAENSEQAEKDMNVTLDTLVNTVDNKQQDFHAAGTRLIDSLQNGINTQWASVSGNIRDKFQTLADEIRKAFELGDLQVTVASVTPVYNNSGSTPNLNAPASSLWNTSMYNGNSNGIYGNNPAFTSWAMATDNASGNAMSATQSITNSIDANTQEVKNMQTSMDNMSNKFDAFSDTQSDTKIYLDSGALVGATADKYYDAFGERAMRDMRAGH